MNLYEILVPTVHRNGKPIRTRFHRVWDKKVRDITGGMTILKPCEGRWIAPSGELFSERMIPVRISCSKEQISLIADITAAYYEQEAIMYYLVSSSVEIKYYGPKRSNRS
jgi:hypothetical protein